MDTSHKAKVTLRDSPSPREGPRAGTAPLVPPAHTLLCSLQGLGTRLGACGGPWVLAAPPGTPPPLAGPGRGWLCALSAQGNSAKPVCFHEFLMCAYTGHVKVHPEGHVRSFGENKGVTWPGECPQNGSRGTPCHRSRSGRHREPGKSLDTHRDTPNSCLSLPAGITDPLSSSPCAVGSAGSSIYRIIGC